MSPRNTAAADDAPLTRDQILVTVGVLAAIAVAALDFTWSARRCPRSSGSWDVQAATGATLRVLPFEDELAEIDPPTSCVRCGAPASETAVFARAY